ncbi:MAG TPA: hypothetical protein VGN04_16610 [Herbaspirillum sp.]|jgi:beta-lactamase superfamily II metal-dependent hydrolase
MQNLDRRGFVLAMLAMPLTGMADSLPAENTPGKTGEKLSPWQPGNLDIHHIATGRGDATFIMMPDGTSLLMDAGASSDPLDVSVATRPSDERRAGEWIGRYVLRHLQAAGRSGLDYFLLTHFHPDHVGDVTADSPDSKLGPYKLTGVMDVAEIVPIDTVIDRGFPAYDYPTVWTAPFATNYFAFVKSRVSKGQRVERFIAGSGSQIRPRGYRPTAAKVDVRNLVVNGEVWTGTGEQARKMFPPLATLARKDYPNENVLSAGIRLRSGDFSYFAAGDLTSYTYDSALPWMDMVTAAASACGPVDVAVAPHHGFFDSLSADAVRMLRPQAWMIDTWHVSQPDLQQLLRMLSDRLYPGRHDVFATTVMDQNLRANPWATRQMRSTDGHIVIRVAPGGGNFNIVVTDNTNEEDRIKFMAAPYASSKKTG